MEEVKSNDIKVEAPVIDTNSISVEDKEGKDVKIDFLSRMVESHDKKSREVTEDDLERVIEDGKVLYNLCFTQHGIYAGGYAVAHAQIDDKDPLRFFVTAENQIIINPVVKRHTRHEVDSLEGCLTFPHLTRKVVPRYHRWECDYQTLVADPENKDKLMLSEVRHEELSGRWAFVWQHEMDHMDGSYIYPHNMNRTNLKKDEEAIKESINKIKENKEDGKKDTI